MKRTGDMVFNFT
jgi:hypothetical protein